MSNDTALLICGLVVCIAIATIMARKYQATSNFGVPGSNPSW